MAKANSTTNTTTNASEETEVVVTKRRQNRKKVEAPVEEKVEICKPAPVDILNQEKIDGAGKQIAAAITMPIVVKGWVKHLQPVAVLKRLFNLIGWNVDASDEFLSEFAVMMDKENNCVKAVPKKATRETNSFQKEFVCEARKNGFKANYSGNTGIWICYKK